jgi:N-acetylglucosaminyldiphosphoundecaprenol N-acetyl-beta-D-mannosaminyltransferase
MTAVFEAARHGSPVDVPTVDVMGVRCFAGTLEQAADAVIERARRPDGGYVVQCNVHVLMTAQRHPVVMKALRRASLVMPDGAPVAWLQTRLCDQPAARIGGPDLMPLVLGRGRDRELRHAFVGSTDAVVDALRSRLVERYPGLEVADAFGPAAGQESAPHTLERLRRASADVVWVALGAPKQELWMLAHARRLAPALVIGVGAAFDFHAGRKRRAPSWMQQTGLEWLHRLAREPRRLAVRYVTTNSAFVAAATREVARRKLVP